MDFDAIESLNEQELNELYDEFNSGRDGYRLGGCNCYCRQGVVHVGASRHVGLGRGTCEYMVELGLTSDASCMVFCGEVVSFDVWGMAEYCAYGWFDSGCYCGAYGGVIWRSEGGWERCGI